MFSKKPCVFLHGAADFVFLRAHCKFQRFRKNVCVLGNQSSTHENEHLVHKKNRFSKNVKKQQGFACVLDPLPPGQRFWLPKPPPPRTEFRAIFFHFPGLSSDRGGGGLSVHQTLENWRSVWQACSKNLRLGRRISTFFKVVFIFICGAVIAKQHEIHMPQNFDRGGGGLDKYFCLRDFASQ